MRDFGGLGFMLCESVKRYRKPKTVVLMVFFFSERVGSTIQIIKFETNIELLLIKI
jgi:hypothetical protein